KSSFRARVADSIAGEGWIVDGSFSGLAFDDLGARRYLDRHRAPALALPVARRLAFDLRSRRDEARLARRMPETVRLGFDAPGLALQRRPPATYRGRAPQVWCRSPGRAPEQRPEDAVSHQLLDLARIAAVWG